MDINCEVLLQEFNKHLLFIYNNAIQSYCIFLWIMLLLMLLEFWLSFSSLSSASPSMLLWASWSSSFMSSALIQSLSSSSWFSFKLKRRYCLIMSCDSLVNNPFSNAYWIYGLCVLRRHLFLHNEEIMDQQSLLLTSCDSYWGAMVSITLLQLTSILFALAVFCFPFILFPFFSC